MPNEVESAVEGIAIVFFNSFCHEENNDNKYKNQ
jgi:hypothetical protein